VSRSVVVTGSSSGIGEATALRLAGHGFRVFAGVRSAEDATALAARAGEGDLIPIELDVTDAAQIAAAAERVSDLTAGEGLVALVGNAGIPVPGPLEALPIEDFREQLEVNLIGQLAVTQAFLPLLRLDEGRIIFVSSIGGRAAFPFAGAYHASKFGLEAVGEVLREELRDAGVGVVMIEPGPTRSEIWSKAQERLADVARRAPAGAIAPYRDRLAAFQRTVEGQKDSMDPGKVAAQIESAIDNRRPLSRYPVGAGAKVLARVRPLIPDAVFDRLAMRPFRPGG
jgi:NAD(P)-dependent dehydrogenase (short-subunit alcohol dehydrogenase family)